MGIFSFGEKKKDVPWIRMIGADQLEEIFEKDGRPKLVFKHSTRCSISSMALSRFEKEWNQANNCDLYFLDLLAHRPISDLIAQRSEIQHQSPQVIVLIDGEVIHHSSHNGISANEIGNIIQKLQQ
jgi:bacillithiol system protein YtxJ